MTNVTPTATNPVTVKQMAAALVLADILDHGLPPVNWTIDALGAGRLVGQVFHPVGTEAERDAVERETVQAFAKFLGSDYRETKYDGLKWTEVVTAGVYEGIRIRVWACVDDVAAIAAEAAATEPTKGGAQDAKPVSA